MCLLLWPSNTPQNYYLLSTTSLYVDSILDPIIPYYGFINTVLRGNLVTVTIFRFCWKYKFYRVSQNYFLMEVKNHKTFVENINLKTKVIFNIQNRYSL